MRAWAIALVGIISDPITLTTAEFDANPDAI